MKLEEYIEKMKKKMIVFQPQSEEDLNIIYKTQIIDIISVEIYRFGVVSLSIAGQLNKLCSLVFTQEEILNTIKKQEKIAEEVVKEVTKKLGKDVMFDIGVILEGIRTLDDVIDTTIKELGHENLFNTVLVPYNVFIQLTHPHAFRQILNYDDEKVDRFKKGCEYFKQNIYNELFDKIERKMTLEKICFIINLIAFLSTTSISIADVIKTKVVDVIKELGGVYYSERPSD
ncbi:MAG: hypothetical protein ACTSX6_09115 [Candidatus Heimdallarchaeaceae archaeon]